MCDGQFSRKDQFWYFFDSEMENPLLNGVCYQTLSKLWQYKENKILDIYTYYSVTCENMQG